MSEINGKIGFEIENPANLLQNLLNKMVYPL